MSGEVAEDEGGATGALAGFPRQGDAGSRAARRLIGDARGGARNWWG